MLTPENTLIVMGYLRSVELHEHMYSRADGTLKVLIISVCPPEDCLYLFLSEILLLERQRGCEDLISKSKVFNQTSSNIPPGRQRYLRISYVPLNPFRSVLLVHGPGVGDQNIKVICFH